MPGYGSIGSYPIMAPDALVVSPGVIAVDVEVVELFASLSGDIGLFASETGAISGSASHSLDLELVATED